MPKKPKLTRNELHFHVPFSKLSQYIDNLRAYKLSLEVYFSAYDLEQLTDESLNIFGTLQYDPSITVHGPFMDLNPGALDPLVKETTLKRFKHTLEIAFRLNAKMVVFHSGYERWKYAHKIEPWLQSSIDTWTTLEPLLKEYNLQVAIENIFEDTPDNLQMLMERLNSSYIGLCFDTGHFNLFSRVPLKQWLETTGIYIKELHIHDNDTTFDSHLAPGKGTFDFEQLYEFIEKNHIKPVFTVEAHSPDDVLESLKYFEV